MGETLAVIVVAGGLVAGSFYLHYSILLLSSRLASNRGMPTRRPLLLVLSLVFCAHLLEVFLFALAYYAMHWSAWMGALAVRRISSAVSTSRHHPTPRWERAISYGPVADIAHALDDVVVDEIESWQSVFGGKHIALPA